METLDGLELSGTGSGLAEDIAVSAGGFSDNLSPSDTDVQAALGTLDSSTGESFVGRGDGGGWDFIETDFTEDGDWHSLDLSSIIPEGTRFVTLDVHPTIDGVNKVFAFRKNTEAGLNFTQGVCQVTGTQNSQQFTVAVESDRTIQYNMSIGVYSTLFFISSWII